jgi:hypothetical protein
VAVLVGVLVGLGVGVVSADAMLATPMPAPSTSIPEAIATAVLIEAATLLLPVVGSRCAAEKGEAVSCQLPGWTLAASWQCESRGGPG